MQKGEGDLAFFYASRKQSDCLLLIGVANTCSSDYSLAMRRYFISYIYFFILFSLLFAPLLSVPMTLEASPTAQSSQNEASSGPALVPVALSNTVDKIQTLYQKTETLKVSFTQATKLDLLGQTISKSGEMLLKRPGRFVIRYTSAPQKTYWSNGKTLWIYLPNEKEVYQQSLKQGEIDEQAKIFLEGLGNLSQSFLVSALSKEQKTEAMLSNSAGFTYLQLLPIEESAFFIWLAIAVDDGGRVRELTIFNTSNNVSHYRFQAFEINQAMDDTLFSLPAELKPLVKKS